MWFDKGGTFISMDVLILLADRRHHSCAPNAALSFRLCLFSITSPFVDVPSSRLQFPLAPQYTFLCDVLTIITTGSHLVTRRSGANDNVWKVWSFVVDCVLGTANSGCHDDVIKWKHFLRYWPLVREIHQSPVNSPHKDQWRGVLMYSLICVWTNGWANNGEAAALGRHRAHYYIIVMVK